MNPQKPPNKAQVEQWAVTLLFHIWRAIDADFKSKYKREIWQIFENKALVSAKQNGTLRGFVTQLCRGVNADTGRNEKSRNEVLEILDCGYDEDILSAVRETTPILILLVRNRMAEIKEAYEEENE